MLLASILPKIILNEVVGRPDLMATITWGRLVILAVLAVVSWVWQPLLPLWKYAAILFVIAGAQELMNVVRETAAWRK
jgi:hypothetical protein